MGKKKPAQQEHPPHPEQPLSSESSELSVTDESIDKRHLKRIKLMQSLFAYTFKPAEKTFGKKESPEKNKTIPDDRLPQDDDLRRQVKAIARDLDNIDQELQKHAPERPLSDINQVDLAILRLIVWEARHKNTPQKVLIDEAVELAKEFGSESSPRFVNGVLGKLLIEEKIKDSD